MNDTNELVPLAEELNRESEDINPRIKALNEQLAALNLGIAAWIPWTPEEDDVAPVYDDNGDRTNVPPPSFYLGYDKCYSDNQQERVWQLAYKYETASGGFKVKPLLDCTRNERIYGLEAFPQVVTELGKKSRSMIKTIREAKSVAVK